MTGCELSVVIACHNDGKYFSEAIESVLGQEHRLRSFEVVVVDDHSTDEETRDVLERWGREDPAVRVLRNAGAGGPATARNVGVAAAAGEWVAFLDADDVWLPGGLQARWEVVEAQAGAEWIGADFQEWNENGSLEATGHDHKDDFVGRILAPAYRSGRALRLERPISHFLRSSLTWTDGYRDGEAGAGAAGGRVPSRPAGARGPAPVVSAGAAERLLFRSAGGRAVPAARGKPHRRGLAAGRLRREWDTLYRLLRHEPGFGPWRRHLRGKLSSVHERYAWEHRAQEHSWWAAWAALRALSYTPASARIWKALLGALLLRR